MALFSQEKMDKIMELFQSIMENTDAAGREEWRKQIEKHTEEMREDRLKREELRNEKAEKINNDSQPEDVYKRQP